MPKFAVLVLLSGLFASVTSKADNPNEPTTKTATTADSVPNTVLFLEVADDADGKARDQRFAADLKMSLDDSKVQVMRMDNAGFGRLAAREQVALVRPLIERQNAVAAIWLAESSPDLLVLHVVVLSRGRALIRLVETKQDDSESDLASAARELLGTSYLFDIPGPKWFVFAGAGSIGGIFRDK